MTITRNIKRTRLAIYLAGAALCAQLTAFADTFGQGTTPLGSAFVETCAGIGYSPSATPGEAWIPGINGAAGATLCNSSTGASVNQSASNVNSTPGHPDAVDHATGSAQIGKLHLDATHTGDAYSFFPEGYADAGWNDLATVTVANVVGAGVWVVPINITGLFSDSGPFAYSAAYVEVFKNGQDIEDYGPSFDAAYNYFAGNNTTHNGCVGPSSWAPEMVAWGAASGNPFCPATLSPNTTVLFALPGVLGQSFDIGIWASLVAGESSDGMPPAGSPPDAASADMSHSILWGGPGVFITNDGEVHDDVTVTSGSGFNYNVAATDTADTPEPSSFLLLVSGLVILAAARRMRSAAL